MRGQRRREISRQISNLMFSVAMADHCDCNFVAIKAKISGAMCLEPISKSPEEGNEAGELDKAHEVLCVVLPTDENSVATVVSKQRSAERAIVA